MDSEPERHEQNMARWTFAGSIGVVAGPLALSAVVVLGIGWRGLLGLFNAGWYAILQGRLYSAMPGQSGTVMAVNNLSGLVGSLIPLSVGWLAERFGLSAAMWVMLLGPLVLLVGVPRQND